MPDIPAIAGRANFWINANGFNKGNLKKVVSNVVSSITPAENTILVSTDKSSGFQLSVISSGISRFCQYWFEISSEAGPPTQETAQLAKPEELFQRAETDLKNMAADLEKGWEAWSFLLKHERKAIQKEIEHVQTLVAGAKKAVEAVLNTSDCNVQALLDEINKIEKSKPAAVLKVRAPGTLNKIAGILSTLILGIWGFALRFGSLVIASPGSGMLFGIGVTLMVMHYAQLAWIEVANARTKDRRKLAEVQDSLITTLQKEVKKKMENKIDGIYSATQQQQTEMHELKQMMQQLLLKDPKSDNASTTITNLEAANKVSPQDAGGNDAIRSKLEELKKLIQKETPKEAVLQAINETIELMNAVKQKPTELA